MSKLARLSLLVALMSLTLASDLLAAGDVLFVAGKRTLDDDAEPVDEQEVYGVTAFLRGKNWPIALQLGYEASDSGEEDFGGIPFGPFQIGEFEGEGSLMEAYLGAAMIWDQFKSIRPFVGGGISFVGVDFEGREVVTETDFDDDDDLIGVFVNAGAFFRIGEHFDIGGSLRHLFFAEANLFDEESDVSYFQYNLLIGWGW